MAEQQVSRFEFAQRGLSRGGLAPADVAARRTAGFLLRIRCAVRFPDHCRDGRLRPKAREMSAQGSDKFATFPVATLALRRVPKS